ncbi:MAG TPA: hypothetical protein VFW78_02155 [Bacteroidia bacterium]|nr:hypothetical protein [Bacteroidia bacterium]
MKPGVLQRPESKGFIASLIIILLLVLISIRLNAQGLEKIIVEKYHCVYYPADSSVKADVPPSGSVTYRIFADLKPGYTLQSVYGAPGHPMLLSSTGTIYNHPDYGKFIANTIDDRKLGTTMVLIDSWISLGAGSFSSFAVPKTADDTSNSFITTASPALLQKGSPATGIPLLKSDGLAIVTAVPPRITQIGMDSLLNNLKDVSTPPGGYRFETTNGAWGCLGGAAGPDSSTNVICIAQFTTTGDLHFEWNMQLGTPGGGVENYVAKNPSGSEILTPALSVSLSTAEVFKDSKSKKKRKTANKG